MLTVDATLRPREAGGKPQTPGEDPPPSRGSKRVRLRGPGYRRRVERTLTSAACRAVGSGGSAFSRRRWSGVVWLHSENLGGTVVRAAAMPEVRESANPCCGVEASHGGRGSRPLGVAGDVQRLHDIFDRGGERLALTGVGEQSSGVLGKARLPGGKRRALAASPRAGLTITPIQERRPNGTAHRSKKRKRRDPGPVARNDHARRSWSRRHRS